MMVAIFYSPADGKQSSQFEKVSSDRSLQEHLGSIDLNVLTVSRGRVGGIDGIGYSSFVGQCPLLKIPNLITLYKMLFRT